LKELDCLVLPVEKKGHLINCQSFSVLVKENSPINRDDLMQKLLDQGISTRRGIMTSHRETAYKNNGTFTLPTSEMLADNSLLLPIYCSMKMEDVKYTISLIIDLLK
jgi:perosamine synthetase